jgi:hypothetical protein
VDFHKTNGQDIQQGGISAYLMYYSATVDFPSGYRANCIRDDNGFAGFDCGFQSNGGAPPPVRPGSRVTFAGTISFQRAERGWLIGEITANPTSTVSSNNVEGNPTGPAPVPTATTNQAGAVRDAAPADDVEAYRRVAEARRAHSEQLGGTTIFIINRSTRSISSFYLYGFDTNWRLQLRERIRPGGRGRIDIPASGLPCTNHLMTEFSDGEAFNAGNAPLCPTTTIIVGEPNEPNGD